MNRVVLTFGKHKGSSIQQCDTGYLRWLANKKGTDLEYWANLAQEELNIRNEQDDLEAMADDFLRQSGIEPNSL